MYWDSFTWNDPIYPKFFIAASPKTKHGVIYYSGGNDPEHRYGVAIIITSELERSVTDFIPLGDRVMLLKLNTSHRVMNIIQAYAPTNDKTDDMVEESYGNLEEALRLTKNGEITVILGDFNAKIGSENEDGDYVGKYGLGERNTRDDRLAQFCSEKQLSIANTFFKLHMRRLYTWRSPADREGHIVRNQIDYILVKREYKKFIKSVKTYPGADINSDHNPVVMDIKICRFVKSKPVPRQKRTQISEKLEGRLKELENSENTEPAENIESSWANLKDTLIRTQETDIGYANNTKTQEWMTDGIITHE